MFFLYLFCLIRIGHAQINNEISISSDFINNKLQNEKKFVFSSGVFVVDGTIIIPDGSILIGAGKGITTVKLKAGVNKDLIQSQNFNKFKGSSLITQAPKNIIIKNISLDGNYLNDKWNSGKAKILNSKGNCISLYASRFDIDVETNNCAQNMLYTEANGNRNGLEVDSNIKISGKVSGESCIVFDGPGDILFEKGVIGNCGMKPKNITNNYAGYDGVIIKQNIEINFLHVYGVFNGVGFTTVGKPRVKISHLVSESNKGGVLISQGTWGGIDMLDVHANGYCIPTAASDCKNIKPLDAVRIDSFNGFSINQAFVMRMPNSAKNNLLLKLNGSGSLVKLIILNKTKNKQTLPYVILNGKNNKLFLGGDDIDKSKIINNGINNKIF